MTDGGRRGDLKYRSAARHARLAAQIWFIQIPESSASMTTSLAREMCWRAFVVFLVSFAIAKKELFCSK